VGSAKYLYACGVEESWAELGTPWSFTMVNYLRQHLFRHLGTISLLAASGAVSPALALADIPTDLLGDATTDGFDDVDASDEDRLALLSLLASDARPQIRANAADATLTLGNVDPVQVEALLLRLAKDDWPEVRLAAAVAMANHLTDMQPLGQVGVVAAWATEDHPGPREALAHALSHSRPVVMADMALEVLAADSKPEVRRAAIGAVRARSLEAPETYRRILAARPQDPDRRVRRAARHSFAVVQAKTA